MGAGAGYSVYLGGVTIDTSKIENIKFINLNNSRMEYVGKKNAPFVSFEVHLIKNQKVEEWSAEGYDREINNELDNIFDDSDYVVENGKVYCLLDFDTLSEWNNESFEENVSDEIYDSQDNIIENIEIIKKEKNFKSLSQKEEILLKEYIVIKLKEHLKGDEDIFIKAIYSRGWLHADLPIGDFFSLGYKNIEEVQNNYTYNDIDLQEFSEYNPLIIYKADIKAPNIAKAINNAFEMRYDDDKGYNEYDDDYGDYEYEDY